MKKRPHGLHLLHLFVFVMFISFTISCETQSAMGKTDNYDNPSSEVAIAQENEIILTDSSMAPQEEDVELNESATFSNPENYADITFSMIVPAAETSLPDEENQFQNNTTNDTSHQQIYQSDISSNKTSRSYTIVTTIFAVFLILLSFLLFAKKKKTKLSKKHSDNQHSVIYSNENEIKDNNTVENTLIFTNLNNETEIAESEKTEELSTDFNKDVQHKLCVIEDSKQKECKNDCPIETNISAKQLVTESHSAEYIPIPGFTPVLGSFFSNYVCVLFIDDGQYFIDYHFTNNPKRYGPGRLFSHSWIDGVNYKDGQYLKGGKDRLSIVAVYEVETEKDAKELFEIVLEAYKSRFSELVIYNKGNTKKKEIKKEKNTQDVENQSPTIAEVGFAEEDIISQDVENQSPTIVVKNYSDKVLEFSSFDSFQQEYIKQISDWEPSLLIKTKNNGRIKKDGYNCAIKADSFLGVDSSINVSIYVRFSTIEGVSRLCFCSTKGKLSFPLYFSMRKEFSFNINSKSIYAEYSEDDKPIREKIDSLINVLSGEDLYVLFNDKTASIDKHSVENVLLLLKAMSFIIQLHNDKYEQDKSNWINNSKIKPRKVKYEQDKSNWVTDNHVNPMDYYIALKLKDLKYEKLNEEGPSIIIGSSGNKYQTSLTNCTCMDFKSRELEKLQFRPCKHMYYLAQKLGVTDLLVSPEPPPYKSDSIVELILKSRRQLLHTSGYLTTEFVEGWKNPLITFSKPLKMTNTKTREIHQVKLWLNRHNVLIDDSGPFYDSSGGDVYLDGKNVGPYWAGYESVYCFKINAGGTEEIYRKIIDGKCFNLFLTIRNNNQEYCVEFPGDIIDFPNLYYCTYRDVTRDYEYMKKYQNGEIKPSHYSDLFGEL